MEKLGINLKHSQSSLIYVRSDQSREVTDFNELASEIKKILFVIEEFKVNSTIGILTKKSNALIALTLGVLEASHPFCYLSDDNNLIEDLKDFNSRFFFSDKKIYSCHVKLQKSLIIFNKDIYFYEVETVRNLRSFEDGGNEMFKLCYVIKTSGTSGKKNKIVHVTYSSIASNILSLQQIFQLNNKDIILSLTPITFDPFIVDLFLSLLAGSSLMFIEDSLQLDKSLFFGNGVTFLQTTPTLFQYCGISKDILSKSSSLKYLVLGGEQFPAVEEVRAWQNWNDDDRKRIFNIYGITEMSCWASIHEITKDDFKYDKIPLGKPLDDTDFAYYSSAVEDVEELVLVSKSRVCFIDNSDVDKKLEKLQDELFAQRTGDYVKKKDGLLFWCGRTNDIIKRFGVRVDLNAIESKAIEFLGTSQVACVFVKKHVVLFYVSNSDLTEQLYKYLKNNLNSNQIPDHIKRIEFLPTNDHGKISKEKLRNLYKEIYVTSVTEDIEKIFLETINQMFNLNLKTSCKEIKRDGDEPDGKRMRGDLDSTFNQLGGKSFDALRVAMKFDERIHGNDLLPKLLDNQHTIKELIEYLTNCVPKKEKFVDLPGNDNKFLKQFHSYDMEKCVDSSPAMLYINDQIYISIGSHSNKLININASTLSIVSQLHLGDRIECEVAQFKSYGVVGCYDGFLYCFDVLTGEIKWKFQSNAMIKSKAVVIDELIVFANYDSNSNVRCLKIEDDHVELMWSKKLGNLGIFANLLRLDDDCILVATLSQSLHKIKAANGSELWRKNLNHPVFSSPKKIPGRNEFIVAEVTKNLHCIDFKGVTLWTYDNFEGQIFSSFLLSNEDEIIRIIFGSHDKNLRCFKYEKKEINLEWQVTLQSQIFSTPTKLFDKFIISSTTSGYMNFINPQDGTIAYSKKLPGELFSSPLVHNNVIFIGCRDNNFYALTV